MCIPIPIGTNGVFDLNATCFDEWAVDASTKSTDHLTYILRSVFLIVIASLKQSQSGTPGLIKNAFFGIYRWKDFLKWRVVNQKAAIKVLNPDAFIPDAMAGTNYFDMDVANRYRWLLENTADLPVSPPPNRGVNVPPGPLPGDPVPPAPTGTASTPGQLKYEIYLQPCRSTKNPDEIAGFLCYIFIRDPNFNLDENICKFLYASGRVRDTPVSGKKGLSSTFGRANNIEPDVLQSVMEIKNEDTSVTMTSRVDWNQRCDMYDRFVEIVQMNNCVKETITEDDVETYIQDHPELDFDGMYLLTLSNFTHAF